MWSLVRSLLLRFRTAGVSVPQPRNSKAAGSRRTVIERIAIVDDNGFQRDVLERMVISAGYECRSFEGPLQALQALADDGVDLLISDVFMPQISGYELARRIREFVPDLKCVLVTSHEQDEIDPDQACTVDAVLHKPITAKLLIDTIRRMSAV